MGNYMEPNEPVEPKSPARIAFSLLWLAIKLLAVLLLANGQAATFVYQNF